ncbi:MAG TPA: histidine kinase [Saprospiraceae bacterium]|nr:histidine kinase [Saprospiraceae bacterium]HMQ82703.1 histidine kinase [Saprospiraceae bacterium]
MKINTRFFIRKFWIEILAIPPMLMAFCYFLYGQAYFNSWKNFAQMSSPWLFMAVLSPICCHWVRRKCLSLFPKIEDWPKRIFWSVIGYMTCTVGFAKATYFILVFLHFTHVVPSEKDFYSMMFIGFLTIMSLAAIYEGISYFQKWRTILMENDRLEQLQLETQYQSLQNQISPHFLFNSFNVLSSLISENPQRAEAFVDELSNVYRYLLRSNEQEMDCVKDELRFIRSFFHLLETRHEKGIALDIQVSPKWMDKKLPTLALQILVENAVKHNEVNPDHPLHIRIYEGKDQLNQPALLVQNNLQPKAARAKSNRVGLDNLRQRYALLNVRGFEVLQEHGFFTIVLPLLDQQQHKPAYSNFA